MSATQFGLIHQIRGLQLHQQLSLWGIVVFSLYAILLFVLSKIALASTNKGLFTSLHIGTIAIKMMVTIGVVLIYKSRFAPEGNLYILPFIILYICYTIFETWLLMKISSNVKSAH